jgi:hypothetical protein
MAGKSETINLVDHQKQNKWRENSTVRATTEVKEMAGKSATIHMDQLKQKMAGKFYDTCVEGGKSETMKLVDHQKIKWGENSTTRATMEVKKWQVNPQLHMDQLKQKNGGKVLQHVRRGGGGMAGKSETTCISGSQKWRKQRMVGYVLPELAAGWTRGLEVWTLVQVAVGSTHHLGVLQVALHIKQIN